MCVNSKVERPPEVGDLIEISYGLYQHWVVYIGDGEVVHKTPTAKRILLRKVGGTKVMVDRIAKVRRRNMSEVVSGHKWTVNNKLGESQFPKEEIRTRALDNSGPCSYDMFNDNCEHFANHCRYNFPYSFQAGNPERCFTKMLYVTFLGWAWVFIMKREASKYGGQAPAAHSSQSRHGDVLNFARTFRPTQASLLDTVLFFISRCIMAFTDDELCAAC